MIKPVQGFDDSNALSSVCTFCARFKSVEKRTCQAFPKEIPDIIWHGENTHQFPVDGDHGLQFVSLILPKVKV